MRACSSSRASCHPLMVTDPTLSVVFLATIFLLPSSLYRKGTAQINLSDAVERGQAVGKVAAEPTDGPEPRSKKSKNGVLSARIGITKGHEGVFQQTEIFAKSNIAVPQASEAKIVQSV